MCGDHHLRITQCVYHGGSPPHVRGPRRKLCFFVSRITPSAGTTFNQSVTLGSKWDHPRMCGDHMDKLPYEKMVMGSPPHVRGPQTMATIFKKYDGITPACAGTTLHNILTQRYCRDHPRMCGDHLTSKQPTTLCRGSPPHVRGPRNTPALIMSAIGITPACAGTTSTKSICI